MIDDLQVTVFVSGELPSSERTQEDMNWLLLSEFCQIKQNLKRKKKNHLSHIIYFSMQTVPHNSRHNVSCQFFIYALYQINVSFYSQSADFFLINGYWILSNLFLHASTEMIERVFFFYPTINNTENWVHCLLNMKPNLHFWIHYTWFIFQS